MFFIYKALMQNLIKMTLCNFFLVSHGNSSFYKIFLTTPKTFLFVFITHFGSTTFLSFINSSLSTSIYYIQFY